MGKWSYLYFQCFAHKKRGHSETNQIIKYVDRYMNYTERPLLSCFLILVVFA